MGQFTYEYPRPAVTVDLAVFVLDVDTIRVLMIRRKHDPFAGRWAFPGGFIEIEEPFEHAARRELKEETGLEPAGPVQFIGVFGKPGRDPRGRTISMAHATVVRGPAPHVAGGDDAAEAKWLTLDEAKDLAFDHDEILTVARAWLRHAMLDGPTGLGLLPERFTEADVVTLFQTVFGRPLGIQTCADGLNAQAWIESRLADGFIAKGKKEGVFVTCKMPADHARYSFPFVFFYEYE